MKLHHALNIHDDYHHIVATLLHHDYVKTHDTYKILSSDDTLFIESKFTNKLYNVIVYSSGIYSCDNRDIKIMIGNHDDIYNSGLI